MPWVGLKSHWCVPFLVNLQKDKRYNLFTRCCTFTNGPPTFAREKFQSCKGSLKFCNVTLHTGKCKSMSATAESYSRLVKMIMTCSSAKCISKGLRLSHIIKNDSNKHLYMYLLKYYIEMFAFRECIKYKYYQILKCIEGHKIFIYKSLSHHFYTISL